MDLLQLVTTWRSGSSFLGDMLRSLGASFYHYEPLVGRGGGVTRFTKGHNFKEALIAIEEIKSMFACNTTIIGRMVI